MSRKPTPAPSPIAELRANLDQLIEQTTSTTLSARGGGRLRRKSGVSSRS
jgi:hypothetical protein